MPAGPVGRSWQASDINDAGQIVGFGTYDGVNHGFLLTPLHCRSPNNPPTLQSLAGRMPVSPSPPRPCRFPASGTKAARPAGLAIASATNFTLTVSNVTGLQSGLRSPTASSAAPWRYICRVSPARQSPVTAASRGRSHRLDACDGQCRFLPRRRHFSKGVTTVTCWASDSSHNTNTCTFTVTVLGQPGLRSPGI